MKVNNIDYEEICLLGKGKGGYSYLVKKDNIYYVIKQIHHEPCSYYHFANKLETEVKDYNRLKDIGILMPKLLEVDYENERILKEYIEGDTILEYVKQDKVKDIYFKQINKISNILYSFHLNIDYFPTNFIVKDDILYYIDFECNEYMEQYNFKNWGIKYWKKTKELLDYLKKC
ncbi:MAG: hypothetical protein MR270_06425 [Erysipelotrichaceae bacterium]|nr:hypothetical protein [Erysipelotrichaceae bacterium]